MEGSPPEGQRVHACNNPPRPPLYTDHRQHCIDPSLGTLPSELCLGPGAGGALQRLQPGPPSFGSVSSAPVAHKANDELENPPPNDSKNKKKRKLEL